MLKTLSDSTLSSLRNNGSVPGQIYSLNLEQVYAALTTYVEQLTEEDLTAFNRFDWIPDGWPLYTAFMGNC